MVEHGSFLPRAVGSNPTWGQFFLTCRLIHLSARVLDKMKLLSLDEVVGSFLSRVIDCRVHPNVITALTFPITFGIFIAILFPGPWSFVLALTLAVIRAILDSTDGAVARSCDQCSHTGAVLDIVSDTVFVAGLSVLGAWATVRHFHPFMLVPMGLLSLALAVSIKQIVFTVQNKSEPKSSIEKIIANMSIITTLGATAVVKVMVHSANISIVG